MSSIGEKLAELRRQKGLSQAELARLLNLGQSTIAMYEKNKRAPDYHQLARLADFFNVSVDYLLGRKREDEKDAPPPNENLLAAARDPLFRKLLVQIPDLSEEEKRSVAEHWEWALEFVKKKRR